MLRCEALLLPHGTDLRLVEGTEFRRTQLESDREQRRAVADEWLAKLQAAGWTTEPTW